jgi:hypothetical protein
MPSATAPLARFAREEKSGGRACMAAEYSVGTGQLFVKIFLDLLQKSFAAFRGKFPYRGPSTPGLRALRGALPSGLLFGAVQIRAERVRA